MKDRAARERRWNLRLELESGRRRSSQTHARGAVRDVALSVILGSRRSGAERARANLYVVLKRVP